MSEICKNCGTVGKTRSVTNGSIWIEIILWLCFLIPGIIYSIWRLTTRHQACSSCGGQNMVPLDTPVGAKLAADSGYQPPPAYKGSPAAEQFGRRIGRMFAKK
jgi:hypothetical protein